MPPRKAIAPEDEPLNVVEAVEKAGNEEQLTAWLHAATVALRETHLDLTAAWRVFGDGADKGLLIDVAGACQDRGIDTSEFWDAHAEARATQLAKELQHGPLVAVKLLAIKHVWDPTT